MKSGRDQTEFFPKSKTKEEESRQINQSASYKALLILM